MLRFKKLFKIGELKPFCKDTGNNYDIETMVATIGCNSCFNCDHVATYFINVRISQMEWSIFKREVEFEFYSNSILSSFEKEWSLNFFKLHSIIFSNGVEFKKFKLHSIIFLNGVEFEKNSNSTPLYFQTEWSLKKIQTPLHYIFKRSGV